MKTLNFFIVVFALVLSFNTNETFAQAGSEVTIGYVIPPHQAAYIPDSLYDITFLTAPTVDLNIEGELVANLVIKIPVAQTTTREAAAKTQYLNNLKQMTIADATGKKYLFISNTTAGSAPTLISRDTDLYLETQSSVTAGQDFFIHVKGRN